MSCLFLLLLIILTTLSAHNEFPLLTSEGSFMEAPRNGVLLLRAQGGPAVQILAPSEMSRIYMSAEGRVHVKLLVTEFRVPADGEICVTFHGVRGCGGGAAVLPAGDAVVNLSIKLASKLVDGGWHQLTIDLISVAGHTVATHFANVLLVPMKVEALTAVAPHQVRAWDPWLTRLWPSSQPGVLGLSGTYFFLYNDAHSKDKFSNSQVAAMATSEYSPSSPAHVSLPNDAEQGRRLLAGSSLLVDGILYLFYSTGDPFQLPRAESSILLAAAPKPASTAQPWAFQKVKQWKEIAPVEPLYRAWKGEKGTSNEGRPLTVHWRDPYLLEDPQSGQWFMYFAATRFTPQVRGFLCPFGPTIPVLCFMFRTARGTRNQHGRPHRLKHDQCGE